MGLAVYQVSRQAVATCLHEMDPEGCDRRRRPKLKRRAYTNPGPNHCWHIDGDDKLKPDGFVIHGCIDGYSRKIICFIFEQKAQNNFIFVSFVETIFKCLCFFIKFCTAGSTKFTVKRHCCGTNFTFQ